MSHDQQRSRAGSASLYSEIYAYERKTWDALCQSGHSLLPYLAKNCVMLFPGGTILSCDTRPTLEDSLRDNGFEPWKSYILSDDAVVPLGSDAALIYYKVQAERHTDVSKGGGEHRLYRAVCCSTWMKEDGHGYAWKMVSHHQTPM